jgi:hypothetical protein
MNLNVGQRVLFGRSQGEKTLGEVVKVNRATVKVRQLEARGTLRSYPVGTVWTVPVQFVELAPADATPDPVKDRLVAGLPTRLPRRSQEPRRPCLVNIVTGQRTYGPPGMSEEMLYEMLANR